MEMEFVFLSSFGTHYTVYKQDSVTSPLTGCSVCLTLSAFLLRFTQRPDCVAQCHHEECFAAQISPPHKCLALCLTLSGL